MPGTLLPISAYKRSDISDKVSRKVIINTECIPFVPNVLLRDLYLFFQKEVARMLSTLTDLSTTSISLNFECLNVLND